MIPCGTSGGVTNTTGLNVFTLNPDWKAQKQCQKVGFKRVAAMSRWPGDFGFLQQPACCPAPTPNMKYLAKAITIEISVGGITEQSWNGTNNRNFPPPNKIDAQQSGYSSYRYAYTGTMDKVGNFSATRQERSVCNNVTTQNMSFPSDGSGRSKTTTNYTDNCGNAAWVGVSGLGMLSIFDAGRGFTGPADSNDPAWVPNDYFDPPADLPSVSVSCGQVAITFPYFDAIIGTADQINALDLYDYSAYEGYNSYPGFEATYPNTSYGAMATTWAGEPLRVELTDSKLTVNFRGTLTTVEQPSPDNPDSAVVTNTYTYSYSYECEFSKPMYYADVIADEEVLAATWNLGDDDYYPWIYTPTWKTPLVTRDGSSNGGLDQGAVFPDCAAWSPTNVATTPPDFPGGLTVNTGNRAGGLLTYSSTPYTGRVIGGPQAVGNARYFNFSQSVQEFCSDSGFCSYCQTGFGEYSPGELPKTATQWTDSTMGNYIPETGGGLVQGPLGVPVLIKWCEQLPPWPSANLARPFGRDRFVVDYSTIPQFVDDGHGVNLNAACAGGTNGIDSASYDLTLPNGMSEICLFPQSFLYAYRRWKTCRAIGSAIGITSAVQTTPESYPGAGDGVVTLTTAETHWLAVGMVSGVSYGYADAVDFYNVPGLGTGVSVLAATPNTTTFTVHGVLSAAYASGGYIATAGMTQDLAQWDDTCPNHQFVAQTWQTTYRQNGGIKYTETQGMLKPVAGKPSVLLCSPNAESFPARTPVYSIPFGSIAYEVCFAPSEWHGAFTQAVQDPFWQPPVQCSTDLSGGHALLKEQPSPCTDGVQGTLPVMPIWFRYPPLVEPMMTMPAGAPPLVAGVVLGTGTPGSLYGNGNSMPGIFGSIAPGRSQGGCRDNVSAGQMNMIQEQFMACEDWKPVVHYNCGAIQYALAYASGYIPPNNIVGQIPPGGGGDLPGDGSPTGL